MLLTRTSSETPPSPTAVSGIGRIRALLRWVPLVAATGVLAQRALSGVLAKLGHPGAALDDAYIHFQYARAIAEGHPFRFQAGEPISTGATSFLWPLILAPFYAVGFRDEAILWPAWILSFLALGALAYEAWALTLPLAGRAAAIGAAAMVLAFGGHAWCAASGMEVVPFAWLITSASRRASDWAEADARAAERNERNERTRRKLLILAAFACLAPLMRPEGAITAVALGIIVAAFPRPNALVVRDRDLSRLEGVPFLVLAILPNLLLFALTGHATSSTAQVKLLPGNPYYVLPDAALGNARTLLGTILDGQVWSAEFLPKGGAVLACLGLAALVWRGQATGRNTRATLVLLLALSMFVPCLYVTFLWNRLRYLWPFATGWFIGLACLARAVAAIVGRIDRRAGPPAAAVTVGVFAGALLVRLEWVLEDVAQSASGIDRQQATLGRWAKATLPADARIGVNDTGAIAYFGDRHTFDVVGLTSPSEGRYWVAGAGSRLEHYERLKTTAPAALPTHFIVYPEWMGCDPVIGRNLHEATVTDASILGGQTMRASLARWDHLGSGDRPWTALATVVDELDVADLESEEAHRYELLGAREGEQAAHEGNAPDGDVVVDGGRTNRLRDRFTVKLPSSGPVVGIARMENLGSRAAIKIRLGTAELPPIDLEVGPWVEIRFAVPDSARGSAVDVTVEADSPFSSFHYWFGTEAGTAGEPG
jgi:hypothetical protein